MAVFIPTGVVFTTKSASSIKFWAWLSLFKKLWSSIWFSKFFINSSSDDLLRDITEIVERFKFIKPWIIDLAAPPEPRTIDFFFANFKFFNG